MLVQKIVSTLFIHYEQVQNADAIRMQPSKDMDILLLRLLLVEQFHHSHFHI